MKLCRTLGYATGRRLLKWILNSAVIKCRYVCVQDLLLLYWQAARNVSKDMRAVSCQVWKLFWSDIRIATIRLCDVTMIQYEKLVNKNVACYLTTTTVAFIVPSESSDCTTIYFVVFQHYFFLVDHIQKFLCVAFSLRTPFIPLMCNLFCEINYIEQSFTW